MRTGTEDLARSLGVLFPDVAGQHIDAVVEAEKRRLRDRPI